MVSTGDLTSEEEGNSLLRRRKGDSRRESLTTEDVKDIRKPLKLDLGDRDLRKRRISGANVTINEELKINTDDPGDVKPSEKEKPDSLLGLRKIGWMEMLWMELTRGYSLHNDQERYNEKRRKVYATVKVPWELEKFLLFGFLQCLDAFCYVFTILPVRCILSLFTFIFRIKPWTSAQTCDYLKLFIIISASLVMQMFDTSMWYHIVRGQGVIKLYIVYNMLEVFDKLFSSFGQDILDSLMWTASEPSDKRKLPSTILHFFAATLYAFAHAFLVFLQATTLNVAFNSQAQSLLTILISNNFVELKGSVFKKFAKPNLFQMACSDVRERFHLLVLVVFVILRNMTANHWRIEYFYELLPDLFIVSISEVFVDWLKHAFITKFNDISYAVYQDFTITLAFDVAKSREESAFSDFADQVSRRMGFIPIPICIMLIRTIIQSIDFTSNLANTFIVLTWLLLFIVKLINGVYLHSKAIDHIVKYRTLQEEAEYDLYRKRMLASKSKSAPNSPRLSLIDFTDVLTQTQKATGAHGFTVSDLLSHYEELKHVPIKTPPATLLEQSPTPRRSVSMMNFSWEEKREVSFPPSIPEYDEKTDDNESQYGSNPAPIKEKQSQQSPRRKPNVPMTPRECADLEEVQAFKLLNSSEPVQEIQS